MHYSFQLKFKPNGYQRYKKMVNPSRVKKYLAMLRNFTDFQRSCGNTNNFFFFFLNVGLSLLKKDSLEKGFATVGDFISFLKKKNFSLGLARGSCSLVLFINRSLFFLKVRAPSGCLIFFKKLFSFCRFSPVLEHFKKNKFSFGKNFYKKITVRGVAKNAADHRNGGKGRSGIKR